MYSPIISLSVWLRITFYFAMELLVLKTPVTELSILIFPAWPGKIFGLRKAEIPCIKIIRWREFLVFIKISRPQNIENEVT